MEEEEGEKVCHAGTKCGEEDGGLISGGRSLVRPERQRGARFTGGKWPEYASV